MPFAACIIYERILKVERGFSLSRTEFPNFKALLAAMEADGMLTVNRAVQHQLLVAASPLAPFSGAAGGFGSGSKDDVKEEDMGPVPDPQPGDDDEFVFDLFVEALRVLAAPGENTVSLPFPASRVDECMCELDRNWVQRSPRWTNRFRGLCERMQEEGHLVVATSRGVTTVIECKYFHGQGLSIDQIRAARAVILEGAREVDLDGRDGGGSRDHRSGHRDGGHPREQGRDLPRGDRDLLSDNGVLQATWDALEEVVRKRGLGFHYSVVSDYVRAKVPRWSLKGSSFKSFGSVMEVFEIDDKIRVRLGSGRHKGSKFVIGFRDRDRGWLLEEDNVRRGERRDDVGRGERRGGKGRRGRDGGGRRDGDRHEGRGLRSRNSPGGDDRNMVDVNEEHGDGMDEDRDGANMDQNAIGSDEMDKGDSAGQGDNLAGDDGEKRGQRGDMAMKDPPASGTDGQPGGAGKSGGGLVDIPYDDSVQQASSGGRQSAVDEQRLGSEDHTDGMNDARGSLIDHQDGDSGDPSPLVGSKETSNNLEGQKPDMEHSAAIESSGNGNGDAPS